MITASTRFLSRELKDFASAWNTETLVVGLDSSQYALTAERPFSVALRNNSNGLIRRPPASMCFICAVTSSPETGTGSALDDLRMIEANISRKNARWVSGTFTRSIWLSMRARSTTTYRRNQCRRFGMAGIHSRSSDRVASYSFGGISVKRRLSYSLAGLAIVSRSGRRTAQERLRCRGRNLCVFIPETNTATGSTSLPVALRPSTTAANKRVPLPQNGSSKVWPAVVYDRISECTTGGWNLAGNRKR